MNLRIVPFVGLAALLSSGCYSDVESFATAKAKQDCKRIQECNRSRFVDDFNDDMSRCREDIEDLILDAADIAEAIGWDYDADSGRECVKASRQLRKDCSDDASEEIADVCAEALSEGF